MDFCSRETSLRPTELFPESGQITFAIIKNTEANKNHGAVVLRARNQINVAGQKLNAAKRNYKINVFAKFREEVKPHVETIAKQRGASAVFYSRVGSGFLAMWNDPTIDITHDVAKSMSQAKGLPPIPPMPKPTTQKPPVPKPGPAPAPKK